MHPVNKPFTYRMHPQLNRSTKTGRVYRVVCVVSTKNAGPAGLYPAGPQNLLVLLAKIKIAHFAAHTHILCSAARNIGIQMLVAIVTATSSGCIHRGIRAPFHAVVCTLGLCGLLPACTSLFHFSTLSALEHRTTLRPPGLAYYLGSTKGSML